MTLDDGEWRPQVMGDDVQGNGTSGKRCAGDYAIAWSVAMPLPSGLLRECARYAGSHIWCEDDAVVLASETIAALHSVKAGQHVLKLPSPRPVWDLRDGRKLGDALTEIEMAITPPETRLYYLGREDPFGE